jgi:hypothetical protein
MYASLIVVNLVQFADDGDNGSYILITNERWVNDISAGNLDTVCA